MVHRSLLLSLSIALSLWAPACAEETAAPGDGGGPDTPDAGSRADSGAEPDGGAEPDSGGGTGDDAGAGAVTIRQVQDPESAGHVGVGSTVRIEGALVAAIDTYEERGEGMGFVSDVWIADPAGGPWSGLHVYMPAQVPCDGRASLRLGDVVTVEGTVQEFAVPSDGSGRTVTQLIDSSMTCTEAGDGAGPAAEAMDDPTVLTTDATAEAWEGVLVELSGVEASGTVDPFGGFPLREGPPVEDDLYSHAVNLRDRFTTLRGIFHYQFGRWAIYPRAESDVSLGEPRVIEWESGLWGCADGLDGDGDDAVDCDDADCASTAFCRGPTVTVQELQDEASAGHPAADTDLALAGPLVVTAIDTYEEVEGVGHTGTVVVQDADAADARHSGVHVFIPSTVEPCGDGPLMPGDRVYVAGRYREYADSGDSGGTLTEIASGVVSCRMPGDPLAPTPIATPSDLGDPLTAEPWEGVLVELSDVAVAAAPGPFGRFALSEGVFVDDDLHPVSVIRGDRIIRLAGVLTYQFEYQLEPRSADDVEIAPPERDDTACANDLDDDEDGLVDCQDPDCCPTIPCAGQVSERDLVLSEVFYDATDPASDDGREWVEIRNAGSSAVPLACYALGNGSTSYRYSMAQLPPVELEPGGCLLIGGPDCGGVSCTEEVDFDPDFHNGPNAGVALLYGLVSEIMDTNVPVDAVIYGTDNANGLLDSSGAAPSSAHVADVAAGHSLERDSGGGWVDQATPTPGTCTTFTPAP